MMVHSTRRDRFVDLLFPPALYAALRDLNFRT